MSSEDAQVAVADNTVGTESQSESQVTSDDSEVAAKFAEFDMVYIPALALTKQEKPGPSRQAMQRLNSRWSTAYPELGSAMPGATWQNELKTIDAAIAKATEQVQQEQYAAAHETLEAIRDLMMNARRREGVSYPLDTLSDFHITMEEIVKPAMDLTPPDLNESVVANLRILCDEADGKWQEAEAAEFDLTLYGLKPEAAETARQHIANVRAAINKLSDALAGDDPKATIQAARGLKPPFAQAYMFFGDFPTPPPSAGEPAATVSP
jgi:hypothetical protein